MGRKKKVRVTILPVEEPEFKEPEEDIKLIKCNDVDECFRAYKDAVNLYMLNIEKYVTIDSHGVFERIVDIRDEVKATCLQTAGAISGLYSEIKGGSK